MEKRSIGRERMAWGVRPAVGSTFLAVGLILGACQPQRQAPQPAASGQQTPFLTHVVQFPGETLSIIANWYTGSPRNWELLLDANPGLNPNRIRLGDSIQIPRELLSREDPLPRSAVGGGGAGRREVSPSARSRGSAGVPASVGSRSGGAEPERTSDADRSDNQSGQSSREFGGEPTANDVVESRGESGSSVLGEILAPVNDGQSDTSAPDTSASVSEEAAHQAAVTEGAANQDSELADSRSDPSVETQSDSSAQGAPEMRIKSREELLRELLEE